MPALRLEFEIDAEVYPELHAALSALTSPQARAERLRQLAAAGLVWEKVRLHGTAAFAPPPEPAPPVGVVTRPDVAPAAVPSSPRRASRRTRAPQADPDFVDLALNAEPTPVPPVPPPRPERRRARPSRQELEQVIRELPVLMDVVADVSPLPPRDGATHDGALDEAEAATWSAMNPYPDEVEDTAETPPAEVLHVTAIAHKPATRSRLMRMKERGLFKNG